MTFNRLSIFFSGFNYIRINSSLSKKIRSADFLAFLFKHTNEFFADNLSFLFWFRNSCQFSKETLSCIHTNQINIPFFECFLYFITLILAKQSMIHKDTGELSTYGFRKQCSTDRRVHTTGQSQQHLTITDFAANFFYATMHVVFHCPITHCTTNPI